MDALEFIKEWNRMLNTEGKAPCIELYTIRTPEETVSMVEKWTDAHPCKTRQDAFLKQWPNASLDSCGVLTLCPKHLYCDFSCTDKNDTETPKRCKNCTTCRHEFWNQEME